MSSQVKYIGVEVIAITEYIMVNVQSILSFFSSSMEAFKNWNRKKEGREKERY